MTVNKQAATVPANTVGAMPALLASDVFETQYNTNTIGDVGATLTGIVGASIRAIGHRRERLLEEKDQFEEQLQSAQQMVRELHK